MISFDANTPIKYLFTCMPFILQGYKYNHEVISHPVLH